MPKLEPKQIQKELEQGKIWPVYWFYGPEEMKSKELLKRIKKTVLGETPSAFGFENLDGSDVSSRELIDLAQNLSLDQSCRFLVIRNAQSIKEPEVLSTLFGGPQTKESLPYVCVFFAKDLDQRKKFSKTLIEGAAVVPCEAVPEQDKSAWIDYLAKRRSLQLTEDLKISFRSLEPWTLDIVDQELEKFSLLQISNDTETQPPEGSNLEKTTPEQFIDAFLRRDFKRALYHSESFSFELDNTLLVLGLLNWNIKQLAFTIMGTQPKGNSFLAQRFQNYVSNWHLEDLISLQKKCAEMDYELKQTRKLAVGFWDLLISEFCNSV